jgi:hypothetical protein
MADTPLSGFGEYLSRSGGFIKMGCLDAYVFREELLERLESLEVPTAMKDQIRMKIKADFPNIKLA